MKNKLLKIVKIGLMCACLFTTLPTNVMASDLVEQEAEFTQTYEDEEEVDYYTYLEEYNIKTRGSKKPGANASVHNLDISKYNYQIEDFGYRVYTDKWLKSSSGYITVKLSDFTVLEDYHGTSDKITFKLCDSSGVLVTSEKTVSSGIASVTWKNIKSDKKYYVLFEVPTNGNRYSANGSISN